MVQSFGKTKGAVEKDPEPLVGLDDEPKFIHFIFEEFLKAAGDGFADGHVVTIGHALVELLTAWDTRTWLARASRPTGNGSRGHARRMRARARSRP